MLKEIDGKMFKIAFKKATENLMKHKGEINALNVFPVPDGDTGSNMVATMLEGCNYIDRANEEDLMDVLKAAKDGTLMGARGNSGVILSQIIRGFVEGFPGGKVITPQTFIEMLKKAKDVAYSAVMKPVEGTILTVMRFIYERSHEVSDVESFEELMDWILKVVDDAVRITPKLLKKLRDAGVVDAGAKGLYYLFEGMKKAIDGDTEISLDELSQEDIDELPEIAFEDINYQYCTEYIIRVKSGNAMEHYPEVREFLENMGDSVVVVAQDDVLKIHVHTNSPGIVLEELLKKGELLKSKIDNMKIQHEHVVMDTKERKKVAIVAVSSGEGLSKIMRSLGVDEIVKGGQTMNPSTADIRKAIEKANAETVFVFPNNPNIMLAAQQAAQDVDSEVHVVPTTTFQECIAALVNYSPEMEIEEIKKAFEDAIKNVVPLSITVAVRNAKVGRTKIKSGEYLIFLRKNLVSHSFDITQALEKALNKVDMEDKEVMSVFTGKDHKKEDLKKIENLISEKFPDIELEVYEGGQPHYPFLISLE